MGIFTVHLHSTVIKSWSNERPTMAQMYLMKYTSSDGQQNNFRLIDKIQGHWRDIGTLMKIESSVLNDFESHCRGNLKEQCRKVLEAWIAQGSRNYPVTWSGMSTVLKDVLLGEVSCQLEEVLGKHEK